MPTAPPLSESAGPAGETAMPAPTAAVDDSALAARTMLDAFASVGADRFDVTWTNTAGNLRRPRTLRGTLHLLGGPMPQPDNRDWLDSVYIKSISTADLTRAIGAMLGTADAERLNVIVRPYGSGISFIQLDDLSPGKLPRIAPAQFLCIRTSPGIDGAGNYQAWLAMRVPQLRHLDEDREFSRRVRKGAGADLNASGATRLAGSRNFKDRYAPDFPRVTIQDVTPGHWTSAGELERLGLLAPPDDFPALPPPLPVSAGGGKWPSYAMCLDGAPLNSAGKGPDRSRADNWFCFLARQWGHSVEATAGQLLLVSEKAANEGRKYAYDTANNAARAVERQRR